MNDRLLRIAGAILAAIFAIWAWMRMDADRIASHDAGGTFAPLGETRPPIRGEATDQSPPWPTKIPDFLPAFSLIDLQGKSTSIAAWTGKSLVINFWATWCAPCRREIPLMQALSGEWEGRGIQVVGIAVDHRTEVINFARRLKIDYPILVGEQDALDVATSLGFDSPVFPFTVFTDRRGELVALYVGELHRPQADLILSVVEDLNQGHIALFEARRTIAAGLQNLGTRKSG